MMGGTVVLWLRAPGDYSQGHPDWCWEGWILLRCAALWGGAVPGGCWGLGVPPRYQDPARVQEKQGSGGSSSQSLQHEGCGGSRVGPADNVPRRPLARPRLQGRRCSIAIGPCRALSIPAPSALLLLAGGSSSPSPTSSF